MVKLIGNSTTRVRFLPLKEPCQYSDVKRLKMLKSTDISLIPIFESVRWDMGMILILRGECVCLDGNNGIVPMSSLIMIAPQREISRTIGMIRWESAASQSENEFQSRNAGSTGSMYVLQS